MKLYVVRHAHAGNRSAWDGPDDDRPLTRRGRKEAAAIADQLADVDVLRLVSSPAVRCVQSLVPLGDRLRLKVEEDARLLEGASGGEALALADELRDTEGAAVVCSHGDVIPEMLRAWKAGPTRFKDPLVWPKGSTWVLTWEGARWARARYLPPPDVG